MATGGWLDHCQSGRCARLGIDEVHGEVKPADKLALVDKLQKEGRIVAMAGDGINNARGCRSGTGSFFLRRLLTARPSVGRFA